MNTRKCWPFATETIFIRIQTDEIGIRAIRNKRTPIINVIKVFTTLQLLDQAEQIRNVRRRDHWRYVIDIRNWGRGKLLSPFPPENPKGDIR